ncbi:hypothetical protein B0H14DRAFT_3468575 [Mycena olivaceomarginata]|nr:hypothetical protein B0H14DRAFT_3468575 [Mycena olivaceomarginata]
MSSTYTVQITFDRAKNLPVADIGTLSCDPYVLASLVVPDAEPLKFRTPTIRRTRDPTWNSTWTPGPKLSPDRLGKAVARFGPEEMREGFESRETEYVLQKRKGDLHPYILTYLAALIPGEKLRKHNRVVVSVRVLRKDADQSEGRMYTLGPNRYSRHFSPLVGSVVNTKPSEKENDANASDAQTDGRGTKLSATTFIANKLQLTGPVPRALRHRYVGYRPFIKWMFDDSGLAGRLLNLGLRRQYRIIYACDKSTVWGAVDDSGANSSNAATPQGEENKEVREGPALRDATPESMEALARQFLDMTAWGEGAKLFTYVITLDGEWRFTETGPEFCIDLLSKHSMHADLAKEIAYSGEFFVRPLHAHDSKPEETTHPSRSPKDYELVIDNDSGTYRPKKELLPVLETWLADARRLGGLGKVRAMDGFDEGLKKIKEERKKEKEELSKKGKGKGTAPARMVPVRSGTSVSSISSGRIGAESVSSEEVEGALKEMEESQAKEKEKT